MEQGREAPGMEEAATGQETQDQAYGASSNLPPGGMGDWLAEHEQSVRQWRRGEVVEGVAEIRQRGVPVLIFDETREAEDHAAAIGLL